MPNALESLMQPKPAAASKFFDRIKGVATPPKPPEPRPVQQPTPVPTPDGQRNPVQAAPDDEFAPKPMFFAPAIKGPSGAKIVSYLWAYRPIVDRQEGKVAKASDWGNAEINHSTGRKIVHQFKILMPQGTRQTGSLDTAARLLGFPGTGSLPNEIAKRVNAVKYLARREMDLRHEEKQHAKEKSAGNSTVHHEKRINDIRRDVETSKKQAGITENES